MTESDFSQDTRLWYCLRVQPKRENLAAQTLRSLDDVEVLNPRVRYLKMTRRGKVMWEEAMFPSYILAKFDFDLMKRTVEYSMGVSGIVHFGAKFPNVPEEIVVSLQEYLESLGGETIELKPKVSVGDELEVATGPLKGEKGVVVEVRPGVERVAMLMEFLGQENLVNFDIHQMILPKPTL